MSKAYDLKYVLMADDIRQEASQKVILIGFYPNNEIVVPSLPINAPSQSFLILIVPYQKKYSGFTFAIKDPHGQELMKAEGIPEFAEIKKPVPLVFPRSPAVYISEGMHQLLFRLGDEKLKKIGEFRVVKVPPAK